jgi:hypothetical protein
MTEQSMSSLPAVGITDTAGGFGVGVHDANTVTDNMDDELKLFEEAVRDTAGLDTSQNVLLMQG